MRKAIISLFFAGALISCGEQNAGDKALVKDASTGQATATPQASEFADPSYMERGRQQLKEFETQNFDAYGQHFAENVVYTWSGGDSLVGRQAVVDFWKSQFKENIQELTFANDVYLPVKVNQPQKGPDMPGVWLLTWQQVAMKLKNGKSVQFAVHSDYHYDTNNKIDRVYQYYDRAPIQEAMKGK